jgi:hypothetical protein
MSKLAQNKIPQQKLIKTKMMVRVRDEFEFWVDSAAEGIAGSLKM